MFIRHPIIQVVDEAEDRKKGEAESIDIKNEGRCQMHSSVNLYTVRACPSLSASANECHRSTYYHESKHSGGPRIGMPAIAQRSKTMRAVHHCAHHWLHLSDRVVTRSKESRQSCRRRHLHRRVSVQQVNPYMKHELLEALRSQGYLDFSNKKKDPRNKVKEFSAFNTFQVQQTDMNMQGLGVDRIHNQDVICTTLTQKLC
ncbi:hypothetical protein WJX77_004609 [Trebouxia sp. C0004]